MGRSNRKGKPRIAKCAYCGTHGPVTRDHIPPTGIFADPKPNDLITVPSCSSCHEPWSTEDEYFRIRMCLNDQSRGHPDVNGNLDSIFHALNRPRAEGMKRGLLADWRNVDVTTPHGIYLGSRAAFEVDMRRICRVIERIVRGLYFRESGHCLPQEHGAKVISNEMLSEQDPGTIEEMRKTIIEPLAAIRPRIVGRNTFSYRYWLSDVPGTSAWGLVFFGKVQFVALTGPNATRDTVDAPVRA
jgi:hypothetical protein